MCLLKIIYIITCQTWLTRLAKGKDPIEALLEPLSNVVATLLEPLAKLLDPGLGQPQCKWVPKEWCEEVPKEWCEPATKQQCQQVGGGPEVAYSTSPKIITDWRFG